MRASPGKRQDGTQVKSVKGRFDFKSILTRTEETVYVGLVGGNDPASAAVRHAQSFLRFDRRPSYFSHCFFFTGKDDQIREARVIGADPATPDHGGVETASAGRRYGDSERFPNVAVVGFRFPAVKDGEAPGVRVKRMLDAAKHPIAIRERYDLWEMTARWQPFLFEPARTPNPLLQCSHPGAAFVRWVLLAGGIESAPGATDQFDAPEHVWASALWWRDSYKDPSVGVELTLWRCINDPGCDIPESK